MRKKQWTVLVPFLLFIPLIVPIILAEVQIELACTPSCQYTVGDEVNIDVALSSTADPLLIRSYRIRLQSDDTATSKFTFTTGADQFDSFFQKDFMLNAPTASTAVGDNFFGWTMRDALNKGKTLSTKTTIGSLKGKALTAGTVQLSVITDANQLDDQGTFFQQKTVSPFIFHPFLVPAPLTLTISGFACQGAEPGNADLCAGDDQDLPSSGIAKTVVSSCSEPPASTKCEYTCKSTFTLDNGQCVCAGGTTQCGSSCVDTATDEANCGGCGVDGAQFICGSGQSCVGGECQSFTLTSSAIATGTFNDEKYGCYQSGVIVGGGINPPLTVAGIPPGTNSFVVLVDDPDAPADPGPSPFSHWVIWDIPVPADNVLVAEDSVPAGAQQGVSDFDVNQDGNKDTGYGGLCPPTGETHNYRMRAYALDNTANMGSLVANQATKADVLTALGISDDQTSGFPSSVLGLAVLQGTYPPVVCGNGVQESGEACDDGNTATENECAYGTASCTKCNADCTATISLTGRFCGDGTIDAADGETCGSCPADVGVCPPSDGDGDNVDDVNENANCLATPTGYTVYTTGTLTGCIIGDVNINQLINSDDIAAFIAEYNGRSDGFAAATDLTQDSSLNSDDIALFIDKYNKRP